MKGDKPPGGFAHCVCKYCAPGRGRHWKKLERRKAIRRELKNELRKDIKNVEL